MKLNYCFHTHTYRCGHAHGKEEDYIIAAIKHGFKEIGFADHVMLPNHPQPGIRGNFSELEDYIATVTVLKEKYKNQIKVYLGFECEFYEQYANYYRNLLKDPRVDYLIQGQHCFINEQNELEWYLANVNDSKLERYVNDLIKGMKSGLFTYIAHPEVFVTPFKEWDWFLEKQARKICEAAVKYHIPLEINLGGLRSTNKLIVNLRYPCEEFWKIVSEYNVHVYVGVDAHTPEDFENARYDAAEKIITQNNLVLLEKIK